MHEEDTTRHRAPTTDPMSERAGRFQREHARRLQALAYRMLGSMAEAEDVVQDAWLRWVDVSEDGVERPGAFLSRVVTRLCLDRLGSAVARRECYVGVWLPELVPEGDAPCDMTPGPQQQTELAQDVSVAFMLALERLSPLERAALLLHDVFDLDYDDLAAHLEREPAACRQLVSRARRNARSGQTRREVSTEERRHLFEAFTNALRTHDVAALARVLSAEVAFLADGGGKVNATARSLHGAERVARVLVGFARLPSSAVWHFVPARVNGGPGCLVVDRRTRDLIQVIGLEAAAEPGKIAAVYVQRNPDKLGVAARWLADSGSPVTEASTMSS